MSENKKSKILTAARSAFLRYGYKRVNMSEIAMAAGVSRPALYVHFKNKEEIFIGIFLQWVDETIADILAETETLALPEEKIEKAFEIWAVRPFEMMMISPEVKELVDCSFVFAQASLRQGYKKFEASITPIIASFTEENQTKADVSPEMTTHVLVSAVRGFKQTATTPNELRHLIKALLLLTLPRSNE